MTALARTALSLVALLATLQTAASAQDMALPEPVGMDGQPAARMVLSGNSAFLHGDLNGAAKAYRAALARQPDFAVASFNLGLVEAHEGERTRGLSDMDRGIRLAAEHRMSGGFVARLRKLRAAFAGAPVAT